MSIVMNDSIASRETCITISNTNIKYVQNRLSLYNRSYLPAHLIHSIGSHELNFFRGYRGELWWIYIE